MNKRETTVPEWVVKQSRLRVTTMMILFGLTMLLGFLFPLLGLLYAAANLIRLGNLNDLAFRLGITCIILAMVTMTLWSGILCIMIDDMKDSYRARRWLRNEWSRLTGLRSANKTAGESWLRDTAMTIFSRRQPILVVASVYRIASLSNEEVNQRRDCFHAARDVGTLLGFWEETRTLGYYDDQHRAEAMR